VLDRQGDCPDVLALAAEAPAQRLEDAGRLAPVAWDALDAARPVVTADEHHQESQALDAGKSAVPEPGGQARVGSQSAVPGVVQLAAPYIPGAARSAEQSFLVPALADAAAVASPLAASVPELQYSTAVPQAAQLLAAPHVRGQPETH
jgi:hypothetical protein